MKARPKYGESTRFVKQMSSSCFNINRMNITKASSPPEKKSIVLLNSQSSSNLIVVNIYITPVDVNGVSDMSLQQLFPN